VTDKLTPDLGKDNNMDWREDYKRKVVSPQEAAKAVKSGDYIYFSLFCAYPKATLNALFERMKEVEGVSISSMAVPSAIVDIFGKLQGVEGSEKHIRTHEWFTAHPTARELWRVGRGEYTPNNFRECGRLVTDYVKPDVAIIALSRVDDQGYCSFNLCNSFHRETIQAARNKGGKVIFEINEQLPRVLGDNFVHVSEADYIVEFNTEVATIPDIQPRDLDMKIGQYVADLVEDGSSIQLGIGGQPNAVAKLLEGKKDLGVHTEMLTDSVKHLWEIGAITNKKKTLHPGKMVCTFAGGSKELYTWMDNNQMIDCRPVVYTNDPYVIAQNHKQVSINSAIMVDIMGQIASEAIGFRQFSGTGGQQDFNRGAFLSPGGKSFIVLDSSGKRSNKYPTQGEGIIDHDGVISRIVPMMPDGQVLTASRTEAHYIVTEYGVAMLKGKSLRQRAKEMINIAHPDFRSELKAAAKKMQLM
jgi:4-hydroxybutyrate CoA-transferase